MLPNTVGKLQNLETLLLERTLVVELPLAILKLKKLRHLGAYAKIQRDSNSPSTIKPVKMPDKIGCLTSLQSLFSVDVTQGTNLIQNLGNLTEMRFLDVIGLRRESGLEMCASIAKMNHLETLFVSSFQVDEVFDLQFVSPPPPFIKILKLNGRLEKLPDWITSLSDLSKLCLNCTMLKDDPLKVLQGLPKLRNLYIKNYAYDGQELIFEDGSFQKLKILELYTLENLQVLIIEKGAMPNLKELFIQKCEQLKVAPIGIAHLVNLKTLSFLDMPEDFMRRFVQGGEDYWKVKHVPLLNLFNGGNRFGVSTT